MLHLAHLPRSHSHSRFPGKLVEWRTDTSYFGGFAATEDSALGAIARDRASGYVDPVTATFGCSVDAACQKQCGVAKECISLHREGTVLWIPEGDVRSVETW